MGRGIPLTVRIVGTGMTALNPRPVPLASDMMQQAIRMALRSANMQVSDLDALIAVPSMAEPKFMEAHNIATKIGLLPRSDVIVRTIDTGGAGPITALLEAKRLIETEERRAVAIVAGDAVSSLPRDEFLKRADASCSDPMMTLASPVIPHGYDRIAQWQMETYGTTREQLAMCSVLMSTMASRHPMALTKRPHTLEEVLNSPRIAPVTNLLECARRADGAAAVIVASSSFLATGGDPRKQSVVVISGGEASGSLYPPPISDISESIFSCRQAATVAYSKAFLEVEDIDFFGLYDCFSVCLIRAIEAVGLAAPGRGGDYIEEKYIEMIESKRPLQEIMPINTHGGLSAFGAPWEAPAMYLVIEAVAQLTNAAQSRQIKGARRALVYGNGGIFSSSAVAILGTGRY